VRSTRVCVDTAVATAAITAPLPVCRDAHTFAYSAPVFGDGRGRRDAGAAPSSDVRQEGGGAVPGQAGYRRCAPGVGVRGASR